MPLEQTSATAWTRNTDQDSLRVDVSDEDFTKYLDLDNGFDQFQSMDNHVGHSSLETPMGRLAFGASAAQDMPNHSQELMPNMDVSVRQFDNSQMYAPSSSMGPDDYQQYQQYQMYQQINQGHHYRVPPTPVSAEMHAAKYAGPIDDTGHMMFDHHQASFTPLVSPAQTPLEHAFCMTDMSDYMVADDFFSPLTSPAIEAQGSFVFNGSSATASPIDLNADQLAFNSSGPATKKRGRKPNPAVQRAPRSVKQSPAMKPQTRRRQFSLNGFPPEILETMLEKAGTADRLQPDSLKSAAFASSEDSVSPEPLSEALMRPPPVPQHIGKSPSVLHPKSSDPNLPATPAMIMRIPTKQSTAPDQLDGLALNSNFMEDITLPDAATSMSADLPQISIKPTSIDDQSTPTLAAKTPKLSADSTPRISAIKAQNDSNESIEKSRRPDTKTGGRGGRKRQSIPPSTLSPALRPKVSPSISPLVPAPGPGSTAMSAETNALFLASKSNYQNILDGTHLPGVSYPETLAENLSSKRTSHKLAEQGRRNRINLALKEIESLLPPSITASAKKEKSTKDSEEGSPEKGSAAAQGTSKASTVELAIVYIRSLQEELRQTKAKLDAAEKAIDASKSDGSKDT